MGQLFFKKPMQAAIREGRKRTTIRRWKANRPAVRAGQRVYSPGLGWLSIETVETVDLDSLGDDDARADGFETVIALRDVLAALYPDQTADGKRWFRVSFRVARLSASKRSGAAPREGRTPLGTAHAPTHPPVWPASAGSAARQPSVGSNGKGRTLAEGA